MVIDAINAVLGERVSRDVVRSGSDKADVTALFSDLSPAACAALAEQGYEPDDEGCLLIRRTINAEGKAAAGSMVSPPRLPCCGKSAAS